MIDFPTAELLANPKVISFPHLGASTDEAEVNCAIMVADSVRDYLDFLRGNPRYSGVAATDGTPKAFGQSLADAGYATDPDYAKKIDRVADSEPMQRALRALDRETPSTGRVGGFTQAKAIHDLCAAAGLLVWHGGMLESGVGRAYNVALATLANFSIPGDLSPSARYWERDIVTPEWTMAADGMVPVPYHRPGLGVAVDIDRVDDLTARKQTLTVL